MFRNQDVFKLLLPLMISFGCAPKDMSGQAGEGATTIGYFTFASDASLVLSQDFSSIQAKVAGRIMIGGDPGYPEVSEEFEQVMAKADALGAFKHVYLEGPGGPTGDSGIASDECARMMARAEKVKIPIDRRNCQDGSTWLKTWNATGWWDSTVQEVAYFHAKYGATSVEVDNLYRAEVDSPEALLAFVKKFQAMVAEKQVPVSLMLKNPTVADLILLRADKEGLTRFAISEEDFKADWTDIKAASLAMGITTLTSANTDDYKASGYFGE